MFRGHVEKTRTGYIMGNSESHKELFTLAVQEMMGGHYWGQIELRMTPVPLDA
jgi:hypothetical protein